LVLKLQIPTFGAESRELSQFLCPNAIMRSEIHHWFLVIYSDTPGVERFCYFKATTGVFFFFLLLEQLPPNPSPNSSPVKKNRCDVVKSGSVRGKPFGGRLSREMCFNCRWLAGCSPSGRLDARPHTKPRRATSPTSNQMNTPCVF